MFIKGKKADYFRSRFSHAKEKTIHEVYANPSRDKIRAYEQCREKCYSQYGYDFRIISHNCNYFTAAWLTGVYDKNILHVETAYNSYEMEY